jgi:multidrug efflux pump subunit AcrA (membrane-fusion protein)
VDFPVTIKITHPTNILVGMSVTATITTGKVANAIWVPTAALTVSSGHEAVLVPSTALPTSTFPGFGSGASGFGGFGGGSGGFGSGGGGFGGFGGFGAGGASSRFGVAARRLATTIPRAVDVTVGLTNGTDTEIVGGLTAGEKILVPNPAAASTSGTTAGARPFGGGFGFGGF